MVSLPVGLLVGLGNPGSKYENTRHNVGFMLVESMFPTASWKETGGAFVANNQKPLGCPVVKPMQFMNLSGQAVGNFARYFKVASENVVIVHDEIDLPFGTIQLKKGGGEGGHNGLRSISQHLGTKDYLRLRIGVGRPTEARMDVAAWVLQKFSTKEMKELESVLSHAEEALRCLQEKGLAPAQNIFNR